VFPNGTRLCAVVTGVLSGLIFLIQKLKKLTIQAIQQTNWPSITVFTFSRSASVKLGMSNAAVKSAFFQSSCGQ